MRVCHLCDGSVAGDYFRNITAGLTARGIDLLLVELGSGSAPSWLAQFPGVKYRSLDAMGSRKIFSARKKVAELVRSEKIDILHTHLFYSGLAAAFAKKQLGKTTFAMMRHHTGVVRMLGSAFHVRADKWMAERADTVMTVSEAARRYMLDVDGIRRDDIEVVYLGFDFEQMSTNAEKRAETRAEFGFADDDLVIGYVANFAAGKGHVQLINAFDEIKRRVPNAKLILAGKGKLKEVEDTVGVLGLGRRIVFAGWQDDVSAVYNAMDIFVQPSLSEAFSQVLIEAMGCGRPVIATKVGGASEVVENNVNGILIEPDDPDAITASVLELASNSDRRKALAVAGMNSVRERFSAATMVERHLGLYQKWMDED
ncbi:MAG: glycosyltransferase family 4 protein [Acidobacteria bacterium]|nr:glycosyltransferase family 4 protein [Acidobacteriota bacterium]